MFDPLPPDFHNDPQDFRETVHCSGMILPASRPESVFLCTGSYYHVDRA